MGKTGNVDEGCITKGPWGGLSGQSWTYKPDGRVTHVIVRYGLVIDSMSFQDEDWDGFPLESSNDRFGGPGGHTTVKVCIDGPVEHLRDISMTLGDFWGEPVIQSLSFRTNMTKYGPFGSNSGQSVSIPIEGGVVVGFHGRAGNYLNAMGIYLAPRISSFGQSGGQESLPTYLKAKASGLEGCISIGPWGRLEGQPWAYNPEGQITAITISSGSVVDSLSFESESYDGVVVQTENYGGPGGSREKVNIASPAEYLTALDVTFGNFKGQDVVTSICFQTNVEQYGPFGNKKGYSLSIPLEGGAVVGFHGHAGQYLNAIGIYAKPESMSGKEYDYEATQPQIPDITKLALPRDTGPWGGPGGKPWDDGVFPTVKQVDVHIEKALNVIRAVQLSYTKRDGQLVVTQSHGGARGDLIRTIRVDGTSEFLVSIEGFYGPVEGKAGCEAIKCITFYSNKRKFGPYGGEEIGTYFSSASGGQIVGFFGRAGSYLNAIGVHMEYL